MLSLTNLKSEKKSHKHERLLFSQAVVSVMAVIFNVKVVAATFLLVCFVSLKESTCEKKKNVFYFTSKALFVLEIIKF